MHNLMSASRTGSGELLREVARLYTRAQRVVADCCSTTSTQCHLLTELARSGSQPLGELGRRLYLEKSWIGRAVDGLVERELVAKEPNEADARSWIVSLTAAGKRRVKDLNATLDGHAEELLATLGERERDAVNRSLLMLLKLLREDRCATCCLPTPDRKEPSCR